MVLVRASDKRIACDEDLSDSEDEDGRKDEQNYKAKRAKTMSAATNGDSNGTKDIIPAVVAVAAADDDKPVVKEEAAKLAAESEKAMDTSTPAT